MTQHKQLLKELIRLLSVEGQPTKTVVAQTSMGTSFNRSVSDTFFALLLSSKLSADNLANPRGPPDEPSRTTSGPRTTV
jgi:hypothetical protein